MEVKDVKKPAVTRVVYPYDLVEVKWLDAETTNGWEEENEVEPQVPEVITVGFLIVENDKLLSIASTVGDDRTHNSRMVIPRGMVTAQRVIKKGKKRK